MKTNDEHQKHDIPASWCWAKLHEISTVADRDHRTPKYVSEGVPLISPRNFTPGGIDLSDLKQVDVSEYLQFERKCNPGIGDILYSRIGTIGQARKLDFSFNFVALHSIALIKPAAVLAADWLYYLMRSPGISNQARNGIKSVGTPDLGLKRIEQFAFPLPPKEEQARIVSKIEELFSSIDEGERALERVRKLVERYRQSVLKAAVTGELTREWREQHAGELESGEALLTRILEARRQAWEQSELAKMEARDIRPANDNWKKKYEAPQGPEINGLTDYPTDGCGPR